MAAFARRAGRSNSYRIPGTSQTNSKNATTVNSKPHGLTSASCETLMTGNNNRNTSVTTLSTVHTAASSSTTLSPSAPSSPCSPTTNPYASLRNSTVNTTNNSNNSSNDTGVDSTARHSIAVSTYTDHTATISSQESVYGSAESLDVDPFAALTNSHVKFCASTSDRNLYRLTCRGNEHFHNKRYRQAVNEYNKAIRLIAPDDETIAEFTQQLGETANFVALLFANRSASHCMLGEYGKACNDAEQAIRIQSDWGKGFYRKGEAMLGLRRYNDALRCFRECLERDPNNPDARVGIANADIKLEDANNGLFTLQLLSGRDIAMPRSLRPIQNKIFEFATAMRNFIYVIADTDTGDCVVVDACWDVPGILAAVKREGLNLVGAIVTHHHFDHVGGTPPPPFDQFPIRVSGLHTVLKKCPGSTAYVHQDDILGLEPSNPNLPLSRVHPTKDGYVLHLGRRTKIEFLHTPGHTPGSQCLLVNDKRLFTGDTLFLGCCGRLDLPGGSPEEMWHSLQRLSALDDHLIVYPGHEYGGEWSTLAEERMAGALKPCTLDDWLRQQQAQKQHSHGHEEEEEEAEEEEEEAEEEEEEEAEDDDEMCTVSGTPPQMRIPSPIPMPRTASSATAVDIDASNQQQQEPFTTPASARTKTSDDQDSPTTAALSLLQFKLNEVDDDTDDELPSEELVMGGHQRCRSPSPAPPIRPSSASIKSFGLENDSYPSDDDEDEDDDSDHASFYR